jgi:hypothetical protein
MTPQHIEQAKVVYEEFKQQLLGELRYWLENVQAGMPQGAFEARIKEIKGWKFQG